MENITHVQNNTTDNFTDNRITLKELNDEEAKIYHGADILFGTLILPGVIGNLHVLHIYIYKKPHNTTRVYVLLLAMLDLITCGAVLPFNMVNCLLPYMYYDDVSCKIFTFLNGFVTFGSGYALLAIAVERYRKICIPHKKQITLRYAKVSCLLVIVTTCTLSFPTFFMFGSTRIPTHKPGYFGYECHYLMEMRNTYFQFIYTCSIVVLSSTACIALIILYALMGLQVLKQKRKMQESKPTYNGGHASNDTSTPKQKIELSSNTIPQSIATDTDDLSNANIDDLTHASDNGISKVTLSDVNADSRDDLTDGYGNKNLEKDFKTKETIQDISSSRHVLTEKSDRSRKMQRTSYTFFLITMCYLLSYIPHPILRTYQVLNMDWYESLDFTGLISFHTALVTLYFNNVVNSFIYAICDSQFRHEIKTFYTTLFLKMTKLVYFKTTVRRGQSKYRLTN